MNEIWESGAFLPLGTSCILYNVSAKTSSRKKGQVTGSRSKVKITFYRVMNSPKVQNHSRPESTLYFLFHISIWPLTLIFVNKIIARLSDRTHTQNLKKWKKSILYQEVHFLSRDAQHNIRRGYSWRSRTYKCYGFWGVAITNF